MEENDSFQQKSVDQLPGIRISLVITLLILIIPFLQQSLHAQGWNQRSFAEIGGGVMRYGGSIPETSNKAAVSFGLHYEITDQLQLQFTFTTSEAGAHDSTLSNTDHLGNDNRSQHYYFATNINEFTLTPTYDFFNLNNGRQWTPYILAGVGYYNFKPYQVVQYENAKGALRKENRAMEQVEPFSNWQLNVPVGIGIKYGLSPNVRLKLEGKYRFLFNPYLDNFVADNKNDHYYSVSLGLAFRLSPISAASGGKGNRNRKDCNCPPVY
ncbi:MAG TPA: DUF6089 family protein [Arachidicoccus sp.]|nr:DUF6089 family protein [Arachidicoccus sp.]